MAKKKTTENVIAPEDFDPIVAPVTDQDMATLKAVEESIENEEVKPEVIRPQATQTPAEPQIGLSDVKRMIAEALAQQAQDARKPVTLKKQTEHYAHLWRFEGKWVVDFKNQNNDPYLNKPVYSVDVYNEATRAFEPHLELVFHDGTSKKVPLKTYVSVGKRTPVYCLIKERRKIDRSYSIGQTEKKEWNDAESKMKGTGKMVEQVIERYDEVFVLETPEGQIITVNDYVIA